ETGTDVKLTEISLAFNSLMLRHGSVAEDLLNVSTQIREHGRLDARVTRVPVSGGWSSITDSVNEMLEAISVPVNEAARTIEALASGDLDARMPSHAGARPLQGDLLRLGSAINVAVAKLGQASSSVLLVLRELGTAGKLGMQA